VLPRPRFRLPLWAAFAIVAAIYVVRSALRGFDFRPDLPTDAIVLVAFLIVVAAVAYVRTTFTEAPEDDEDRKDQQ
jgi:hypothetical protein